MTSPGSTASNARARSSSSPPTARGRRNFSARMRRSANIMELTNADFKHPIFIFDTPGPFVEMSGENRNLGAVPMDHRAGPQAGEDAGGEQARADRGRHAARCFRRRQHRRRGRHAGDHRCGENAGDGPRLRSRDHQSSDQGRGEGRSRQHGRRDSARARSPPPPGLSPT